MESMVEGCQVHRQAKNRRNGSLAFRRRQAIIRPLSFPPEFGKRGIKPMDRPRRRFLAATTGWAMTFCVLGVVSIFLPWASLSSKFPGKLGSNDSKEFRLVEKLHQEHSQN